MKSILAIFLVAFLPLIAAAQSPKEFYNGRLLAKVNVFSLFDPLTATIQPGIEYRFSKRWSVEVAAGIPFKPFTPHRFRTDSTYHNYQKAKAEIRYYVGKIFYVAPAFFYTKREFSEYKGRYYDDGQKYDYDYAEIHQEIKGFAIKLGVIAPLSKKWAFEFSSGMGKRFMHMTADAINVRSARGIKILLKEDELGRSAGGHVEIGFKVCYVIL